MDAIGRDEDRKERPRVSQCDVPYQFERRRVGDSDRHKANPKLAQWYQGRSGIEVSTKWNPRPPTPDSDDEELPEGNATPSTSESEIVINLYPIMDHTILAMCEEDKSMDFDIKELTRIQRESLDCVSESLAVLDKMRATLNRLTAQTSPTRPGRSPAIDELTRQLAALPRLRRRMTCGVLQELSEKEMAVCAKITKHGIIQRRLAVLLNDVKQQFRYASRLETPYLRRVLSSPRNRMRVPLEVERQWGKMSSNRRMHLRTLYLLTCEKLRRCRGHMGGIRRMKDFDIARQTYMQNVVKLIRISHTYRQLRQRGAILGSGARRMLRGLPSVEEYEPPSTASVLPVGSTRTSKASVVPVAVDSLADVDVSRVYETAGAVCADAHISR
eukprot:GHVO01056452.1.p1 GENE.GHVO01056452.1~~GHVO01056452.1.p1  ORF type:complete len:386 (-),score=45.17 GHVO01056452.1:31-1188(-)